jgi:hypothetical protein
MAISPIEIEESHATLAVRGSGLDTRLGWKAIANCEALEKQNWRAVGQV